MPRGGTSIDKVIPKRSATAIPAATFSERAWRLRQLSAGVASTAGSALSFPESETRDRPDLL
jgi:hypothetical protein